MLVVPLGRPQAAMLPCSDGSDVSFAGFLGWLHYALYSLIRPPLLVFMH